MLMPGITVYSLLFEDIKNILVEKLANSKGYLIFGLWEQVQITRANAKKIEWHVEGISRQQEKDSEGESIGKWANEKSF